MLPTELDGLGLEGRCGVFVLRCRGAHSRPSLQEATALYIAELSCIGDGEALWRSGRFRTPDRARRLGGSASSRSERHAAASAPRSAVRPPESGFAVTNTS